MTSKSVDKQIKTVGNLPQAIACFPEYTDAFNTFFFSSVRELMRRNDPILAQVQFAEVESIRTSVVGGYDSLDHQIAPMKMEATFALPFQVIYNTDISEMAFALYSTAEEGLKSLMPQMFANIDKICDDSGNTIDAKGGTFSWDQVMDAIEKMRIDFDETGQARLPTLITSPAVEKVIAATPMTPEQQVRHNNIIDRKREKFFAQKRIRKIP